MAIGTVDVSHMDDDEEGDHEQKADSGEAVLHEFVYKLKNYFLESERCLRATWCQFVHHQFSPRVCTLFLLLYGF